MKMDEDFHDASEIEQVSLREMTKTLNETITNALNKGGPIKITPYDGEISYRAEEFINDYEERSKAKNWSEQNKFDRFGLYLTGVAKNWHKLILKAEDEPPSTWRELKLRFLEQFMPVDSKRYYREHVLRRKQGVKEPVSQYIIEKRMLCFQMDSDLDEEDIVDHVFDGLLPELKKELEIQNCRTIDDLMGKAKKIEKALSHLPKELRYESDNKSSDVQAKLILDCLKDFGEKIENGFKNMTVDKKKKFEKQERLNPRFNPAYIQNITQQPQGETRGYRSPQQAYDSRYQPNYSNNLYNRSFAPRGRTYYPYNNYNNYQSQPRMWNYSRFEAQYRPIAHNYQQGYNPVPMNYQIRPNYYYPESQINQNESYPQITNEIQNEFQSSGTSGTENKNDQLVPVKLEQTNAKTRDKKVNFQDARELSDNRNSNSRNRCHLCGQIGHFMRFCPLNPAAQLSSNLCYVNNIMLSGTVSENLIYAKLNVNDRDIICLIDCGSEVSIIDEKLCRSLNCELSEYDGPTLRAANDTKVDIIGKTFVDIRIPGTSDVVLVMPTVLKGFRHQILLGNDFNSKAGATINCKDKTVNFTNKTRELRVNLIQPVVAYLEKYQHDYLHSNRNVYLKPKCSTELKVSVSQRRLYPKFFGLVYTDKGVYNLKCLSVESFPTNFENGKTSIKVINNGLSAKRIKIGERVGRVIKQRVYNKETLRNKKQDNIVEIEDETMKSVNNLFKSTDSVIEQPGIKKLPYDPKELMVEKLDMGEISINPNLPLEKRKIIENILIDFSDIFAFDSRNIGNCRVLEHTIDTGDNPPVHAHPYRASKAQRDFIDKQIEEWIEMGIVIPIYSEYSSPVVIVPKKDIDPVTGKNAQRLCIDFRALNQIMVSDKYPLPRIDDILAMLSHCDYFTALDCNQGYLQIFIADEDVKKTAFITHQGLYAFLKMPFGLKNAPATFQRCVDRILGECKYKFAIGYLDDVMCFSKSFEEHIDHLRKVLIRIRNSGMTLKISKCSFAMNKITYLGHVVNKDGIRMDPERLRAINNYPIPRTLTEVRSFLGLAGYHRQFVKDWSHIAEPLTRLTKKDVVFNWGKEQNEAFNTLKGIMMKEPLLMHFDHERETQLKTDASGYACGGILEQKVDGKFHPIEYVSRKMNDTEFYTYCISEKECLAIHFSIIKLDCYLNGIHFTVISDHQALSWLNKKKELSARLRKWALDLLNYDFEVIYKSGINHKDVDALSRAPADPPESEPENMDRYSFVASRNPLRFTDENIIMMQREDPVFGKIYEKVLNGNIDEYKEYFLHEDILYCLVDVKGNQKPLFCLPVEILFETIYSYHDDSYGGHLGFEKTYEKLRNRFFFPNLRTIVEIYCQSCVDCSTGTGLTVRKSGLMIPISTDGPAQVFALDWLGPFMESMVGNKWILVGTDLFTKWAIAKAYKHDQTEQVVDFYINHIVCNFGVPKIILSDRGKQFVSKITKSIFEGMGSSTVTTTAYHPQCNGQTERFNKTLGQMMKKFVVKECKTWDQGLSQLVFGYNASIHKTTGFTPFYLCHGYEPYLPADANLKVLRDSFPDVGTFVESLTTNLHNAWKISAENIEKSGRYNKSIYDQKRKDITYNVGDHVWCHYPRRIVGTSSKLVHQYRGPYEILEKTSPVNFKIKSLKGKEVLDKVHVSRLKRCVPREEFFNYVQKLVDKFENKESTQSDSSDETIVYFENQENRNQVSDSQATEMDELNDIFSDNDTTRSDEIKESGIDQQNPVEIQDTVQVETSNEESSGESSEDAIEQEPAETGPIEGVAPSATPRRSTRIRNRPDFYVALVFVILLVPIFLQSVTGAFQKSNPILWYRSPKLVVTGSNRVLINIKYNSPCQIFKEEPLKNWESDTLYSLCDTHFQNDFISPTRDFCQTPEEVSSKEVLLKRNKRLAFITMGIIALITIAVSTTVGVSSSALVQSSRSRNNIEYLQQKQNELLAQLEQLQANELKVKDILFELQNEIKGIGKAMKSVTEAVNLLNYNLPRTIYYLTTIISRFAMVKDRLIDVSREFKNRKISPKLMDIFNFTLPCGINCDIRTAEAISCNIDMLRKTITLIFDIQITKPKSHIMLADAFTLVNRPNNSTILCENIYNGPNSVIYSQENDCVTTLPTNQQSYLNLVLASDDVNCKSPLPHNITVKFWKGNQCEEKHLVTAQDIVQIKQIAGSNYIYCKSLNIRLYDRYLPCPDFVFILSTSVSFSIGDLKFEASNSTIDISTEFIPHYSDRINFYLMPDLHDFSFDKILRRTSEKIKNITFDHPKIESIELPFGHEISILEILFLVFFIASAVLICLYYCRKRYKKRNTKINNRVRNENFEKVEFREIEKSLSDNEEVDSDDNLEGTSRMKRKSIIITKHKPTAPPLIAITTLLFLVSVPCEGNDSLTLEIKFFNPCYKVDSFQFAETEVIWCEKLFTETIRQPLRELCKPASDSIIKFLIDDSEKARILERISENRKNVVSEYYELMGINKTEVTQIQFQIFDKFKDLKTKINKLVSEWNKGKVEDSTINDFQFPFVKNINVSMYECDYCYYSEHEVQVILRWINPNSGPRDRENNLVYIATNGFIEVISLIIMIFCLCHIHFKIVENFRKIGERKRPIKKTKEKFDSFLV